MKMRLFLIACILFIPLVQDVKPDMCFIPGPDFAMSPHNVVLVCARNQKTGCGNSSAGSMLSTSKAVSMLDKIVEGIRLAGQYGWGKHVVVGNEAG